MTTTSAGDVYFRQILCKLRDKRQQTGAPGRMMAGEQASGHYLEKRIGGGDSKSSFGGSLFLVDAKLRNTHMEHDWTSRDGDLGRERDSRARYYIRARNDIQDELSKLEREKKSLTYFAPDDPRGVRQQLRETTTRVRGGRNMTYDRQHTVMYTPSWDQEIGRKSGNFEGFSTSPKEPNRVSGGRPKTKTRGVSFANSNHGDAQTTSSKLNSHPHSHPHHQHHHPQSSKLDTSGLNLSPRAPIRSQTERAMVGRARGQRGETRRIHSVPRPRSDSMPHVEDSLKISKVVSKSPLLVTSPAGKKSPQVSKNPPR